MRRFRLGIAIGAMLIGLVSGTAVAAAAGATTCNSGTISPGTYSSLTIAGNCSIPSGTVLVQGNLTIQPGAGLDVSSPDATLAVNGNVIIGNGAGFVLGKENPGCPTGGNRINGSLLATGAQMVTVYCTIVKGNVSFQGGTGFFSDFEDNTINGSVAINGYQSVWLGFIRNHVGGSVSFNNNISQSDEDSNEIVTNVIGGTLACSGNWPAPQVGDSLGQPNVVRGAESGQCVGL